MKGLSILQLGDHVAIVVRKAPPQVEHAPDPLHVFYGRRPDDGLKAPDEELVVAADVTGALHHQGAAIGDGGGRLICVDLYSFVYAALEVIAGSIC